MNYIQKYLDMLDTNWPGADATIPQPPTPATVIADPAPVLPVPKALSPAALVPESWLQKAKAVGYEPEFLQEEGFKRVLVDLGIECYDEAEVKQYMSSMCRKLGQGWEWGWVPLREKDNRAGTLKASHHVYNLPVPLHALEKVVLIAERCPSAQFFVTEIRQRPKGDPFLSVVLRWGMERYVIDQWDEPSFTGRAKPLEA